MNSHSISSEAKTILIIENVNFILIRPYLLVWLSQHADNVKAQLCSQLNVFLPVKYKHNKTFHGLQSQASLKTPKYCISNVKKLSMFFRGTTGETSFSTDQF